VSIGAGEGKSNAKAGGREARQNVGRDAALAADERGRRSTWRRVVTALLKKDSVDIPADLKEILTLREEFQLQPAPPNLRSWQSCLSSFLPALCILVMKKCQARKIRYSIQRLPITSELGAGEKLVWECQG